MARAVLLLRNVLELEAREVQDEVFGEAVLAARAAGAHRGHEHVLHRDLDVLERRAAGLAHHEHGLLDVAARAAELPEDRGRLVDELRDAQILNRYLAGARAGAHVRGSGLRRAPAP